MFKKNVVESRYIATLWFDDGTKLTVNLSAESEAVCSTKAERYSDEIFARCGKRASQIEIKKEK